MTYRVELGLGIRRRIGSSRREAVDSQLGYGVMCVGCRDEA
jgi:hypothetical protein